MRRAARLVALVGAVGLGWFFFRAGTRDVVLVYDLGAVRDATSLEVVVRADSTVVRRARLLVRPGEQIRHHIRVPDGRYALDFRIERPAGALSGERDLDIREDQTIVLALAH